jgi:glycosyltransferase involved in cell wall biosynthesis
MSDKIPELAIIIPAYKIDFFETMLNSLAGQTCKDFNVYIGDDCSPFDLKEIVDRYCDTLNVSYTRFDNNIGSKNLVKQWERSIALSNNEKWIWLFSDDDIADLTCVENFIKIAAQNKGRFDIYRFNTVVINEKGEVTRKLAVGPAEETSEEMAYNLLMDKRGNAMQDHIFSRQVYNNMGGLVFTDYAQGADWATSILFSQKKGIAIIPDSKVYWRLSTLNISGSGMLQKNKMFQGHLQFITWIMNHFKYLKSFGSPISYDMIRAGAKFNLINVVIYHYKGLTFGNMLKIIPFMRKELNASLYQIVYDLHSIIISTTLIGRWYVQLIMFIKRKSS